MLQAYVDKIEFLGTHKYQDLISKAFQKGSAVLAREHPRCPRAVAKAICLDLAYILFRHQAWVHAPVLSELTIDYLNSEFGLAHKQAEALVEETIELLHGYIPTEKNWTSDNYDREFLFQLFIASASSENEAQLLAELGFGQNVLRLIHSAASLDPEPNLEIFAPELTQALFNIMKEITAELRKTPWVLDLYRFKVILEAKDLHNKHLLTRQYLEECFALMTHIGWQGASYKEVAHEFQGEDLKKVLDQLIGAELIYMQGAGKHLKYHLSHSAIDLVAQRAAEQVKPILWTELQLYPGPIQRKLLQMEEFKEITDIQAIVKNMHLLDPKSIAPALAKISREKPGAIGQVLPKLQIRRFNTWSKSELCPALAQYVRLPELGTYIEENLLNDTSSKVREKARLAMQDWRRKSYQADHQIESTICP